MTNHEKLGAEYRSCVQAVTDARLAWADAERAHDAEGVRVAVDAMNFAKCCVIAAGEAFKGQTLNDVLATQGPRPTIEEAL